ncbi:CIA30 family protein [Psychrobium sp. MM17-31]|uniref:CIA30 family protein n=1 Tax=Psychrobium sp. MM17-31 TaxID=2917758 RepID=UPI001EF3FC78|nr:CIA30 family protein [Psychrobium sp. MM17-31]MCG7531369.1 CIA30 family protein [Psychrobium sp. MM17-31]
MMKTVITIIGLALMTYNPSLAKKTSSTPTQLAFNSANWRITNDGVMGGLSQGNVVKVNGDIVFTGQISTENNGGFSSTYTALPPLKEGIETVNITVTGDGNDYQLRFRSLFRGYLIGYKLEFPTKANQTISHQLSLRDAQATFRGRLISNAPTLSSDSIRDIGVLISSKTPTPFHITLHNISFSE